MENQFAVPSEKADKCSGEPNSESTNRLQEAARAVVQITACDGSKGSGFFVDRSGYILTAAHVVDLPVLSLTASNGESYSAVVKAMDKKKDLAVLKIERTPSSITPLKLGESLEIQPDELLSSIGHRLGADRSSIDSSKYKMHSNVNGNSFQVFTEQQTQPGASGGPLLTDRGDVVGIVLGGNDLVSAFATAEDAALLLARLNKKFSISHSPDGWARGHWNLLQNRPLVGMVDAGGLSAVGYLGFKMSQIKPGLTNFGIGAGGLCLLAHDVLSWAGSRTDRELTKYSLAGFADAGILTGAAIGLSRTRLGLAVAGAAGLGRLAAEFYPVRTRLHITEDGHPHNSVTERRWRDMTDREQLESTLRKISEINLSTR